MARTTKYSSKNGSRKKAGVYVCDLCKAEFMFQDTLDRHLARKEYFHQKITGFEPDNLF